MKLELNENGKISLFRNDTNKEVEFDFQVDAREALMQKNPKTGDAAYRVPDKKKKFTPNKPKEEVDEVKLPKKGLKTGVKVKEEDTKTEDNTDSGEDSEDVKE
jgi:hypothetical protein